MQEMVNKETLCLTRVTCLRQSWKITAISTKRGKTAKTLRYCMIDSTHRLHRKAEATEKKSRNGKIAIIPQFDCIDNFANDNQE